MRRVMFFLVVLFAASCAHAQTIADVVRWQAGKDAPETPTAPAPASASTAVALPVTLTWASAGATLGYDVYFGTSSNPPKVTSSMSASYQPTLVAGTKYFWKIVAKNPKSTGGVVGPTWNFTTAATVVVPPSPPPPPPTCQDATATNVGGPLPCTYPPPPPPPVQTSAGLFAASNLHYVGSFHATESLGAEDGCGFSFAGGPMAYRPSKGSLFIANRCNNLGEIAIPTLAPYNAVGGIPALPVATMLQPFSDPSEGHFNPSGTSGTTPSGLGGLLVMPDDSLHAAGYLYYDAGGVTTVSHFRRSSALSTPSFGGWFAIGGVGQGYVGQAITPIPAAWQTALGGPAIALGCCLPIISRTSSGPNAIVFDPAAGTPTTPAPGTVLVNYPGDHTTLGSYSSPVADPAYNMATSVGGAFIWSDSYVVIGRTGTGTPCYGPGTGDLTLVGTPVPNSGGEVWCLDPLSGDKGGHAYPYRYWVWAFDLHDLAHVKRGDVNAATGQSWQPWEVKPYAMWPIDLPLGVGGQGLSSTYDPATQQLFILQPYADSGTYGYFAGPVIHVFKVQ